MKKLISITLALAMILSCVCIPAIGAEVETSTTDALKAASINGSDHNQAKVGGTRLLIGGSSAWGYGRKTLVTYDLSAYDAENLPDRFYLQMGSDLADTIAILKDGEFVMEVFETTDNSSYDFATATYANTFDNGSIVKGNVVAEITPANGIALTASNTNYYGLRADISKSVREHILKGDSTVTYLLAVDPARGMKKADGTVVTYLGMYFATADYGSWAGTQQLRPKLITADIPEEDVNTVKSVKVTNGLLTEEFDPEALDDKENLVKTYEIAVINESADVSISYELTTPRSYVEGEVTTGNLEFGPTDLSIPVYSENGELRTYNFKLVKMDEETKASFADYKLAESTLTVRPTEKKVLEGANGGNSSTFYFLMEYPKASVNTIHGRVGVVRYDISEIDSTDENIRASIAMNYHTTAYGNVWLDNNYKIGVYAIDNDDMKWGWVTAEDGSRTITYEDLYVSAPATSVEARAMATKIGTIENNVGGESDIEVITCPTSTSVMANGIRASIDITNYVRTVKLLNPEEKYITLMFGLDEIPDESASASTFTLHHRGEKYNGGYDNYDEFRPRLDWYDFGLDSENGIENVEVKNGILVDEFDPYAVDDYETFTKTYKIAVLDEASDVSVSYNLVSEKSTDEGAVTSGNLEFGPEIITVPVTSESGVTRTYKFELVSFADAGLQVAYPSVGYAFRASNPFVAKDTDMLYLYGNTNITDGSKFDGGAIKLYSPNFAEKKVALDDKTLAYADANGKFGLQVKANVKSLGNTLMVVPSYKYLGKELDGEEYIIKADGIGAAATIGKVGDVVGDNGSIINSEKISYSLKATNYRNDLGTVDMLGDGYPGAMRISGWASNAPNYNARRIAVLQFALSDDMLDAENIEFSFGANSVAQTNNNADSENLVKALRDKGIVITVSEATNLNNEWKYKTDRAGILAEGETAVEKTPVFDIEVNENTLELVNYTYNSSGALSSHHSAGYRIHGGGEAFTNFIKNKIKAGEKLVNLTVEISELQSFYDAMDSNVQGLYIWGASEYSVGGSYNNGRNYMHPFLASLRW